YSILHVSSLVASSSYFFFNHPPHTAIYTLSLHDALPIFTWPFPRTQNCWKPRTRIGREINSSCPSVTHNNVRSPRWTRTVDLARSEEHTSELQSRVDIVCRLLLEKKNKTESDRPE